MTKERKISPSIHCKNIHSNCHCFFNSPFSLASSHAADHALLPPQTNIFTHSHTITQHQCQWQKWSIQTQVATDVSFTNYHSFTRQQEKMTNLETLIEVFNSPLCWFTSLSLTVFFGEGGAIKETLFTLSTILRMQDHPQCFMTRSTGLCRQIFKFAWLMKWKEKNHLLRPATYRFLLWHLDSWGNLAHCATTWPNLEECFPAQQNGFTAELVLQSPSCCLCCPSDNRASVWLSHCHNIMWWGVTQKSKFSQSCNSPKVVLTILRPSQFCQPAAYALESTWFSNLSVFSSPQWQMTSSSI